MFKHNLRNYWSELCGLKGPFPPVLAVHLWRLALNTPTETTMRSIKVYFSNGDHLFTNINGTDSHILAYYIGKEFNLGNGEHDLMAVATKVEFLD